MSAGLPTWLWRAQIMTHCVRAILRTGRFPDHRSVQNTNSENPEVGTAVQSDVGPDGLIFAGIIDLPKHRGPSISSCVERRENRWVVHVG